MSDHAEMKSKRLNEILDGIAVLTTDMEAEEGKSDTPDNREKLASMLAEGETLRKSIEQDAAILGLKSFANDPAHGSKAYGSNPAGGDGVISQPFARAKSLGERLVESEGYKAAITGERSKFDVGFDAKGFLHPSMQQKATVNLAASGLDSTVNYVNMGDPVLLQQQRLTIRDLLAQGQTTQNAVVFIKESSFVNSAGMVAEEGEKPEASMALTTVSMPVKKIAVVLKVTEEMFADFPQMRDYINTRLSFMVSAKEEQQLLNGAGTGNEITGILNTSGIQTQANSADNAVAIFKAITKIRVATGTTGGFEPDGIVIHPNDYQLLKIAKDLNGQYYGGGPFSGTYGNGSYAWQNPIWGLPPVLTTAITQGTALVGAFKLGAQLWQREGIRMDMTNSNEDDFNFNRVSLRVEERLALAVYRPSAFCTVTGIV